MFPSQVPYQREAAVNYALRWALQNNPAYYDYFQIGGDCTNFASQMLYAGAKVMNLTPLYGWYYIDANRKSPSWTGVNYLRNFLVGNTTKGPFAVEVGIAALQPGDLIQLSFAGESHYQHSLPITRIDLPVSPDNIYVSTHSPKKRNAKLSSYTWKQIRFLHIKGVYI